MNRFYSSLIFSKQQYPRVHQVFKPRYNKEFFKRIAKNIDQLKPHARRRLPTIFEAEVNNSDFEDLLKLSSRYNSLKDLQQRLEKSKEGENEEKIREIHEELDEIEQRIMPIAVNIPNRSSKGVPQEDELLDEVKSDFMKQQNLAKVLSHTKLSYINNCYSKSVVGPNSYYYFGIGAKLQQALDDYFLENLTAQGFVPLSGLALGKSALVEAVNSKDLKSYTTDPCRILGDDTRVTALHLTDASREALVGFITTLGHISSNNPFRLVTSGIGYRSGSYWFDSDEKKVTQYPTVHLLSLAPSIERYSMSEYHSIRDIIWNLYKSLDLPCRLTHCSLDSMIANEYDSHRIDIWLPSKQEWIQVSRVSHYIDHITVRTGMKRGHMIDSMVYDGQALIAAIIENKQTATGKFFIPDILKSHIISPTKTELVDYFAPPTNGKVMINHEQRRYLVKKEGYFSHSKKRYVNHTRKRLNNWLAAFFLLFAVMIDWRELWNSWIYEGLKELLYNYAWRPLRWVIRKIIYSSDSRPNSEETYAEAEKPYTKQDLLAVARASRRYIGNLEFSVDRPLPKVEDIIGSTAESEKKEIESEVKKSD